MRQIKAANQDVNQEEGGWVSQNPQNEDALDFDDKPSDNTEPQGPNPINEEEAITPF